MKIKTTNVLKDFEGADIENLTVGKMIARVLGNEKQPDPFKAYILAMEFYKKDEVEIDEADLRIVKEAVKKTEFYTPLAIGQVLQVLEEAKEVKKVK